MKNEFEALFENINHEDFRKKLLKIGAVLKRGKFLQQRVTFNLPKEKHSPNKWLRVRGDGVKVTLALKSIEKDSLDGQFETEFEVSSFGDAVNLLEAIGAQKKSFQETYREIWVYKDAEIVLDTWPFLPELVEIESTDGNSVRCVSEKLGLDWSDARFCTSSTLYAERYNITEDYFNGNIKELRFNSNSPF